MMETIRRLLAFFEAVGQAVAVVLLVVVVLLMVRLAWLGRKSRRLPPNVSPPGGPLRSNGEKPNWVSTTAPVRDALHCIAPRQSPRNPIPDVADHLRRKGYVVVAATERYVQATQSSKRFGFVDDVEFLYDPKTLMLHARSASRVGYSDFGVNRRRLEGIFKELGL